MAKKARTATPPAVDLNKTVQPTRDARRIILIYLIMGMLWILFSDRSVAWLVKDPGRYQLVQLYKGWFYICLSGLVFYLILVKKLVIIRNATDQIISDNEHLHQLAYVDQLTRLPNGVWLHEQGELLLAQASTAGQRVAFGYADIDNFKHVNETMGHAAGDAMLRYIADQLRLGAGPDHSIFRIGGDEFIFLIQDVQSIDAARTMTASFIAQMNSSWQYQGQQFHITASIGIALFPDHGASIHELFQSADAALSHIKERGKNGLAVFDETMRESSWNYIRMYNGLQNAISQSSFMLHYQPIIDLRTREIVSLEALIRWQDPERGAISPMTFIPFAENTGQIFPISDWVVATACQLHQQRRALGQKDLPISINLSGKLLTQGNVVQMVDKLVRMCGDDCRGIEFEVTETAAIGDLGQTVEILTRLKETGFTLSLDDFGVGYSSLTYLRKLPIDRIKIDRAFIEDITSDDSENHRMIFRSIIDLAHNLGLDVVAEGIETLEQLRFLQASGCDLAQGYYFARPMMPSALESFISQFKPDW